MSINRQITNVSPDEKRAWKIVRRANMIQEGLVAIYNGKQKLDQLTAIEKQLKNQDENEQKKGIVDLRDLLNITYGCNFGIIGGSFMNEINVKSKSLPSQEINSDSSDEIENQVDVDQNTNDQDIGD